MLCTFPLQLLLEALYLARQVLALALAFCCLVLAQPQLLTEAGVALLELLELGRQRAQLSALRGA